MAPALAKGLIGGCAVHVNIGAVSCFVRQANGEAREMFVTCGGSYSVLLRDGLLLLLLLLQVDH
jgi:hypothetical protein